MSVNIMYPCPVCGEELKVRTNQKSDDTARVMELHCDRDLCSLFSAVEEYSNEGARIDIRTLRWNDSPFYRSLALALKVEGSVRFGFLRDNYISICRNQTDWMIAVNNRVKLLLTYSPSMLKPRVDYITWCEEAKVLKERAFEFVRQSRENPQDEAVIAVLVDYLEENNLCPITVETIRKHLALKEKERQPCLETSNLPSA